jgi:membrane fusion protein
MTLFRPAVIEAQRRRVYGSVTLHQPAPLAAFTAVAVIGMAIGTVYLSLGTFSKKETVMGWVVPQAGLAQVAAMRGGMVAAVAVNQGDYVRRGQTLVVLDTSEQGGSVWGDRVAVSSTLLTAPVDGQVVAVSARVGKQCRARLCYPSRPKAARWRPKCWFQPARQALSLRAKTCA